MRIATGFVATTLSLAILGGCGRGGDPDSQQENKMARGEFDKGRFVYTDEDEDSDMSMICRAAERGDVDTVTRILERDRAQLNAVAHQLVPDTPLHVAATGGHLEVAELLLRHGANVNTPGDHGATPLHQVAKQGTRKMAELLVRYGADIEARFLDGSRPLHVAAMEGNVELARFLIERGADVQATNDHGMTPLAFAAEGYNPEHAQIVQLLQERGTPSDLRTAMSMGDVNKVRSLLAGDPDLVQKQPRGESLVTDAVMMIVREINRRYLLTNLETGGNRGQAFIINFTSLSAGGRLAAW